MVRTSQKLIAYCGLYCGDCSSHRGVVADLARDLRKELRASRFDKTAEALSELSFFEGLRHYDKCYAALGDMVKLRCKRGCRDGGGNPYCKIRKCCERKSYVGCWECDDFETCEKLAELESGHGRAVIMNIRRIRRKGLKGFLEGKRDWYVRATT